MPPLGVHRTSDVGRDRVLNKEARTMGRERHGSQEALDPPQGPTRRHQRRYDHGYLDNPRRCQPANAQHTCNDEAPSTHPETSMISALNPRATDASDDRSASPIQGRCSRRPPQSRTRTAIQGTGARYPPRTPAGGADERAYRPARPQDQKHDETCWNIVSKLQRHAATG